MKTFIKTFFVIILAALAVIGCDEPPQAIPVQVRLNKELISNLPVGSTQTLIATLTPKDADVTVVWSSEDESIAVVNEDGEVTGVAPGTVVITAAVDQETATCKVVVTSVKPKSIKIVPSTVYLEKDGVRELEVVAEPAGAVLENLTWKSDNPKIVSVDAGKLTALDLGEAKVTVECIGEDGKCAAVCDITVVEDGSAAPSAVSEIKLLNATMKLSEGEERTLVWTVLPENAADKSVTIVSDNEECVTVTPEGLVKAIKTGTATVTVTANDGSGVSSSCVVTVIDASEAEPKVESVTISSVGGAMDVEVGLQLQLKAEVYPADLNPQISWIISDDNNELDYASIDQNGLVKGLVAKQVNVKVGDLDKLDWPSVIVTVYADGVSSSITLKVIPRQPDDILFDLPEEGFIRVGQSWNFNPRVVPEGLGYQVYCFATLPDGRAQNEAYSNFTPTTAGAITARFAISSNDNLVHDNIRKDISLPVIPYYVETITLPESMNVDAGSSFILTPTFTSDVAGHQPTYKDVKWTSSDETKATVDANGKVTAVSAGSVEITATTSSGYSVPAGQSQKSATCTLNISESVVPINIGDYYYSDGTWSTELNPDKTVIGVIFARANSASSDNLLAKDYPGCIHGLVLSTEEYVLPCTTDRNWLRADLINWMAENGYDQWSENAKYCGYNNTQGLLALNEALVASSGDIIHVYHVEAAVQHREKVQSPNGASAWYVPSYLEIKELSNNLDVVNASLEKVGGTTLRRMYEYVYDHHTSAGAVPTVGYADQHYYYSNNITMDTFYAYNMNNNQLVNPKVATDPWTSVSGERTQLPVRVVLAF